MISGKQILNASIPNSKLQNPAAYPTKSNKDMAAEITAVDGDEATAVAVAFTPAADSNVEVFVNGLGENVGNGVKTKSCYFSGDGGTTARAISDIVAGDVLYWVGSVAGYELDASDVIDFSYVV